MSYKKQREEVYNKCSGHCAYCGKQIEIKDMQIDHIIPQSDWNNIFKERVRLDYMIPTFLKHLQVEDLHSIENLNSACRVCNKWKSTHHLELFRSEIQEQTKRLQLRSSNYRMAKLYGLVLETNVKVKFYFEK